MASNSDEVDILLDSMADGKSFYDLVDAGGQASEQIQPGTDITYSVTIGYGTEEKELGGSTVNSLFGSREDSSSATGDKQITVYALRHLNNIRMAKLHGIVWGWNNFRDVGFRNNTSDLSDDFIDFDASTWANTSVSILSRVGGVSTGAAQNPLASTATKFVALDDLGIGGVALNSGMPVSGNGFLLKNFDITAGTSGAAGLFGSTGSIVSGLYMVDPSVVGADNTGALVGDLTNGSVTDCGVYLTSGDKRAGRTVSGANNVGGLVGKVSSSSSGITSSFAAIDTSGTSVVGGLVGLASNTVKLSYSSGTVKATGADSAAGGLVGDLAADATQCYTTSNVYCDATAGAFAGILSNIGDYNYAYGYVVKADGTVDAASASNTYGLAGVAGTSAWTANTKSYYLQGYGYNSKVTSSSYKTMSFTDCQSDNGSAYVSKPYASTLSGQAFPLYDPTGIGSHYGDWPTEITASWKNGAGAQLEAYTTLTGAIPEFADSIHHSAPDYTATNSSGASYLAFWDGGWTRDDGVSMALGMTKSTVMTATYSSIAYPDFATLLGVLSDKNDGFL